MCGAGRAFMLLYALSAALQCDEPAIIHAAICPVLRSAIVVSMLLLLLEKKKLNN